MASKKAYLIGIKGVGMAALAIYLRQSGYEVSGSDVALHFVTEKQLKDIKIHEGFNAKNLGNIKYDLVIASAAYDQENPEVKEAKKRKINLKYYSEVLGEISSSKKVIAVAGIHGKTTTTAMLAFILKQAGLDPSYIIGAVDTTNFDNPSCAGNGDYFVLEADEYRKSPQNNSPKFLDLNPQIAIISSIELDHPDIFPSIEEVYNAFYSLACRVPRTGTIILCVDYPKAKKLQGSLADRHFETYGFDPSSRWRILNVKTTSIGMTFSLESQGQAHGPFEIQLSGNHNVLNATAAIICALNIKIDENVIKKSLTKFKTVKRRFEKISDADGITIIDDYAHHPTAIAATIEATKRKYIGSKIWCVFQPHTYSRTEKLLEEFAQCFKGADNVVITDIFASEREKKGNITGEDLAAEVKKHQSKVRYLPYGEKITRYLVGNVLKPAVILTMGAGNIYELASQIKKELELRSKIGKK